MKKSFLVIGLSRFGLSVVQSLTDLGAEVIAVDINEEAVKKVQKLKIMCRMANTARDCISSSCGGAMVLIKN